MGGGGSPSTTTQIQDIPPEFKPAFTALFNSSFGAARTSAGQPGFGGPFQGGQATQIANDITGTNPLQGFGFQGQSPFAPNLGPFQSPFSNPNIAGLPFSGFGGFGGQQGGFGGQQGGQPGQGFSAFGPGPGLGQGFQPSTQQQGLQPGDFGTPGFGGQGFSPGALSQAQQNISLLQGDNRAAPNFQATTNAPPGFSPGTPAIPGQGVAPTLPEGVNPDGSIQGSGRTFGNRGQGGGRFGTASFAGPFTGTAEEAQAAALAFRQFQDAQGTVGGTGGGGAVPGAPPVPGQNVGGGAGLPGAVSTGSTAIPLVGGPPIVGQPFPEQFTAGSSPLEFESLAQREAVGRQLQGIGNPLLNLGSFTAGGGFLTPESNPFLSANIQAGLRPAVQQFENSVLPAFSSQAIQSGAFGGSSARDLAFNQLASGFGQQLTDTASQIAFDNFQRERLLQTQAGQLLDEGSRLNQLTPEILAQVGLGQRELAQRPLDEALLQFQEGINAPFRPLFPLASIIQGGDIGSTFSTTVPSPSPIASGIAGALGGAGTGAGLASLLGLEGGSGQAATGLGALLGGIGGGLG